MTNYQKVLEALLNAAGQEVHVSRLLEILPTSDSIRSCICKLRKAGFPIHARRGTRKLGPGSYWLEAEGETRDRAMAFVNLPRRPTGSTREGSADFKNNSITVKFSNAINEPNPIRTLRTEIDRREKEEREKKRKKGWNPDPIIIIRQKELLEWIKAQLEALDPDPTPIPETAQALAQKASLLSHSLEREKGQNDDNNDGSGNDAADSGNGSQNSCHARSAG
jgi:hypothetical protein